MAVAATRAVGERDPAPILEIHGRRPALGVDQLVDLWRFREVLRAFVVRRVKVKYKEAVVGVGWSVLQPLLTAAVFAVFLGRIAKVPSDGVPYVVFALAGTAPWSYFATATALAMESLVVDRGLVRKVYFPREILPLSAILAGLLDLAAGLATVVVVAALVDGLAPSWCWLALPLPVLLLVVTAAATSLCFAAVNVYYRDARHALPFLLQLGMYTAPVLYPLSLVPAAWRTWYSVLNPLVPAIDGVRRALVSHTWPDVPVSLAALAWATALLLGAYAFFKRVERGFADHV